jgi:hypothetical protein
MGPYFLYKTRKEAFVIIQEIGARFVIQASNEMPNNCKKEPPKRWNQRRPQKDIVIKVVDDPKNNDKVKINKDKNNDVSLATTFDALHEAIQKSTVYRGSDGLQLPLIVFIKRWNLLEKGW